MRTELPCLPLIQERFWNAIKDELTEEEKEYSSEFEFDMFIQTWESTALGFGKTEGQRITYAYTTIVRHPYSGWHGVFFGERLAYKIKDPNEKFYVDARDRKMKPVYEKSIYFRGRSKN